MIQFQSSFNIIKFVLIPLKEILIILYFLKNPLARFVKHKLIPSRAWRVRFFDEQHEEANVIF